MLAARARWSGCRGRSAADLDGDERRSTTRTRVPPGTSSSGHSTREGMPVRSSSQRKRSRRPGLDLLDDARRAPRRRPRSRAAARPAPARARPRRRATPRAPPSSAPTRARAPRAARSPSRPRARPPATRRLRDRLASATQRLHYKEGTTHAPGPHGHPAGRARRALVRHLLPAAQRADRLPRHRGRRRGGQPRQRPAPPPRGRGPREGDPALRQLPRRRRLRGPRDLRHDAVHQARRADDLLRDRHEHGLA